jgi:hypothetical protein
MKAIKAAKGLSFCLSDYSFSFFFMNLSLTNARKSRPPHAIRRELS